MFPTLNESIHKIVVLQQLNQGVALETKFEQQIETLVGLLKIRITEKSISEVANSLLEQTFDVRISALEWFGNNEVNTTDFSHLMNDLMVKNIQLAPYSTLAETLSKVLMVQSDIVAPIFNQLPNTFEDVAADISKERPTYSMVKMMLLLPTPKQKYIKYWIDASLRLEIGLILSELILTDQIQLSKSRIKTELIDFLMDSITKFGAYAIFTEVWKPQKADLSNLTNNMKILAAKVELENGFGKVVTADTFSQMFQN